MKSFTFDVQARVTQEIVELFGAYTEDQVIDGLISGDFATSLVNGEVINLINGDLAAKVSTEDVDGEFNDFEA